MNLYGRYSVGWTCDGTPGSARPKTSSLDDDVYLQVAIRRGELPTFDFLARYPKPLACAEYRVEKRLRLVDLHSGSGADACVSRAHANSIVAGTPVLPVFSTCHHASAYSHKL